ncbi:hypothetical protein ACFX2G_009813 [Malus domestica]
MRVYSVSSLATIAFKQHRLRSPLLKLLTGSRHRRDISLLLEVGCGCGCGVSVLREGELQRWGGEETKKRNEGECSTFREIGGTKGSGVLVCGVFSRMRTVMGRNKRKWAWETVPNTGRSGYLFSYIF